MPRGERREPGRRAELAFLGVGLLGFAAFAPSALGLGGEGYTAFADLYLFNGTIAAASATCLIRAVYGRGARAAWAGFGAGLALWTAGSVYWSLALADLERTPYPSLADAFYLAAIPCFFVGISVLSKKIGGRFGPARWLDGAVGGLAAAAAGTAVLSPALVGLTRGDPAAVFTNTAYPLGDLILLSFVAMAVLVVGSQGATLFLLIGAGLVTWTVADVAYLVLEATSSYSGGWIDLLWPVGALLIASAALSPVREPRGRDRHRASVALPALFAGVAVALLVIDHFERLIEPAIWLAAATLLAVVIRLALSFRENDSLMRSLRAEAVGDALTGLGNRRALFEHLDAVIGDPSAGRHILAILDLDGFKAYNDSFGHLAGDDLLRRMGAKLDAAVGASGAAYRLGGDEFCVLAPTERVAPDRIVAAARAALCEQGEAFEIGASCGVVEIPQPGLDASEAMRLADNAMYEEKASRLDRHDQETRKVLMRILRDREPDLSEHVSDVAALATGMGRALSLDAEELDVLLRTAELHDVGKIAIPEEILHKPGPLDEEEWALMRKHTLIGERILGAAPALEQVAAAVRSSHERWDGRGYPDGLAGAEIPLASRIVLVCDAYDAMTTDRDYRDAMSPEAALAELRRAAGTQFDPGLVELFCGLAAERRSPERAVELS